MKAHNVLLQFAKDKVAAVAGLQVPARVAFQHQAQWRVRRPLSRTALSSGGLQLLLEEERLADAVHVAKRLIYLRAAIDLDSVMVPILDPHLAGDGRKIPDDLFNLPLEAGLLFRVLGVRQQNERIDLLLIEYFPARWRRVVQPASHILMRHPQPEPAVR